jgi:hypothetical protein
MQNKLKAVYHTAELLAVVCKEELRTSFFIGQMLDTRGQK